MYICLEVLISSLMRLRLLQRWSRRYIKFFVFLLFYIIYRLYSWMKIINKFSFIIFQYFLFLFPCLYYSLVSCELLHAPRFTRHIYARQWLDACRPPHSDSIPNLSRYARLTYFTKDTHSPTDNYTINNLEISFLFLFLLINHSQKSGRRGGSRSSLN